MTDWVGEVTPTLVWLEWDSSPCRTSSRLSASTCLIPAVLLPTLGSLLKGRAGREQRGRGGPTGDLGSLEGWRERMVGRVKACG